MDEKSQDMVDRALGELARDVADGTPRPGADLIARVLADAADAVPPPVQPVRSATLEARPRLSEILFGWGGGAVAALSLCLALGIGVGLSMDAADMPGFGDPGAEIALTMEGGLAADGVL